MSAPSTYQHTQVKVYHGFGHKHNLTLYGHVYENKFSAARKYNNNILTNIIYLVRLFLVKPIAGVKVRLEWKNQLIDSITEADGFYKFEWESDEDVPAGWHAATVQLLNANGDMVKTGEGKVFVPHSTQFGFISDIDDTILISHSATIFKRIWIMLSNDPRSRGTFENVGRHYKLWALAHTEPKVPNPFFYVSSSEWNLYEDLKAFFKYNDLPNGVFLLSQLKKWYQLFKSGKTKHEGKLLRVYRILNAFPLQKFILIGDNSQADPSIYKMICDKYPEKIFAVYIRNVVKRNESTARELLDTIESAGIFTCLFASNDEAIAHSKKIGLIDNDQWVK